MKAMRCLSTLLLIAMTLARPCIASPDLASTGRSLPPHRWIYLQTSLFPAEHRAQVAALLERVAAEGYNGVVFNDFKFMRWDSVPEGYPGYWKVMHDTCQRLKLDLIAAVMPIGYSNGLLSRDPNLAEGLPVREAPFVVRNGLLVPDDTPPLANGGFEASNKNRPSGWDFVDEPGAISFIDNDIRFEGRASLRMQDIAKIDPHHHHARACQTLHLDPFRNYRVSVAVKTREWNADDTRIMILGKDGRQLNFQILPIERTQDWKRINITFNTLESADVKLYLGTWEGRSGTIWWDDVRIEPAGFMNVLRRAGTPLRLSNSSETLTFKEGIDFETIRDPLMGMDPWAGDYTSWHTPPVVRIRPDGGMKEGYRVKANYFHAAIIYDDQVPCCMSDPKVYEILAEQAKQVQHLLQPDGYMMMHNEIRIQGWDDSCTQRNTSTVDILTDNVKRCVEILHQADPGKPLYIWSDMFDPNHNARKGGPYYLVKGNGPWYGGWKGLPKEVGIVNWQMDPGSRGKTLAHFAELGHHQILAGYYDGDPHMIAGWMKEAQGLENVDGVMYTTWRSNYTHTQAFLDALK